MTVGLLEEDGALAAAAARELPARLAEFDAAVLGPGLGTSGGAVAAIRAVVAGARLPLVRDADGLTAFSGRARALARRRGPTVATPHPGEAGRLLGRPARDVQSDRLAAVRRLARTSGCCVLLKGEASLTATPDGRVVVNPTGSALLATAGSGDVLAGVVAALLAGGLRAEDAAAAGAWLHGAAADRLALTLGDAGLLAREVADAVPRARRALRERDTGRGTRDR
jgi:NAD(P)H-hydrate epimerase